MKNDGGSAFPVRKGDHAWCIPNEQCRLGEGMTLRDYFAAKAMTALVIARDHATPHAPAVAMDAYGIADAMIAERAK